MRAWMIWLVLSAGLIIAEMFSLDLVLIMVATGAAGAAVAAGLGAGVPLQVLVFTIVSILALVLVRPLARRHLNASADPVRHGIEALKGADALVLQRVDEYGGLVKIGGEEWTARAYDATQVFEPGQKAQVIEIKGATALVWRHP